MDYIENKFSMDYTKNIDQESRCVSNDGQVPWKYINNIETNQSYEPSTSVKEYLCFEYF